MTDRRYNDDEVSAIFLAAAEGPQATSLSVPRSEGLTLADLQEIGREVGIAPEAVAQAARGLELRGRGASSALQEPWRQPSPPAAAIWSAPRQASGFCW